MRTMCQKKWTQLGQNVLRSDQRLSPYKFVLEWCPPIRQTNMRMFSAHKHTAGCWGWPAVNMNYIDLHVDTTAAPGRAVLGPAHTAAPGRTGRQTNNRGRLTHWQCIIPDAVLPSETRWWWWCRWSRWFWSLLSSCGLWASIDMCSAHTHTSHKHTPPMSENRQDTRTRVCLGFFFFLSAFSTFYILLIESRHSSTWSRDTVKAKCICVYLELPSHFF